MKTLNDSRNTQKTSWISLLIVLIFLAFVFYLDQTIKPTNKMYMLLTVLQKGSVYALAAVSMNLLNGYTGLFSLGHAGFMLIGAYTYAIFTIPSSARDTVYQYFDAAIRLSFPEVFSNVMGPAGTALGVLVAVIPRKVPESRPRSHHSDAATKRKEPMTEPEMERPDYQRFEPAEEFCAYQQVQARNRRYQAGSLDLRSGSDRDGFHHYHREAGQLHLRPRLQGDP